MDCYGWCAEAESGTGALEAREKVYPVVRDLSLEVVK